MDKLDGYKTPQNPDTGSEDAGDEYDDNSEESELGDKSDEGSMEGDKCDGEEEGTRDDDDVAEEDGPARKRRYVQRGRREWTELGFFDRTAMLESEIEAAILAIATEKMNDSNLFEWPEIKRADKKKTISLWVQRENYYKAGGSTHVETYYCPLKNRCGCGVQLRITRAPASVALDWSGGPHTYERCHSQETSKFLTVKQRVAVSKIARINPGASGTEVRRALHESLQRFSPGSRV